MITAKWKQGFESLYHADAQKVADEIISIGESATPAQIVEKGRDEQTELHRCFTWDNDAAADKWRLHEARQIVCHLVIDRGEDAKPEEPETRIFYRGTQSAYIPTARIVRNENEYASTLYRAYAELRAFRDKYKMLSELETLFDAIDSITA